MRLKLLCFGRLREILTPQLSFELTSSPATVADLWQTLRERYPALVAYDGAIAIAVNQAFASLSTPLHEGDEVALLPPVSGGLGESELSIASAHARLQSEPIDSAALLAECRADEDGAVCLFDGIVRNHSLNRRTLYLEYDSYPTMALAEMEKLALAALSNHAIRDLRIAHRVGRLEIGESSVVIVVASAHRAAAFDACRWIIDLLKKTVPIWKKEFFADGAAWADGDPFPPELSI
jgi:molybdopterin synthase catalytic subunit